MAWVAVAVAGGAVAGGLISANASSNAADTAANAQTSSTNASIAQQNKQFDAVQKLLSPYVTAGNSALTGQQDLLGLNGNGAQQTAINGITNGSQYQTMLQQGNNNILQNAAATGGLRGGNTQNAIAQFSPQLLNQLIQQQYSNLGGLTSIGQNAAAGVGNAGQNNANAVSNLLTQQGAATAGNALAQGAATTSAVNSITSGIGSFAGLGGFGKLGSTTTNGIDFGTGNGW